MMIGVAPGSALAAMMAPRKLQSPGALVHAVAVAVSSVRSTSNVVSNNGFRLAGLFKKRGDVFAESRELEEAVCVNFKEAPTKTTSVNSDQVIDARSLRR